MATRLVTRQAILDQDLLGGIYGTATAGAAGTLTDTTLLQIGGQSVDRYSNFFLYRPNAANTADVYRRIASEGYAPSTGVLTHGGPNYTEAPLAGGPADDGYYELWPVDPREVNRAYTRALTTQCFSIQQDDIVTSGRSRYRVSSGLNILTAAGDIDFEGGVGSWTAGGTNTIATSTEQFVYSAASGKITYQDNTTLAQLAVTLTPAPYTFQLWLYIPDSYDGTDLRLQMNSYTGSTVVNVDIDMDATNQWVRHAGTITPLPSDLVGTLDLIENGTAATAGRVLYIDGAQVESGDAVSPFSPLGMTTHNEVLEVMQVRGTEPNVDMSPWRTGGRTWLPEWDNDVLYLRFDPAPTGTLRLIWKKPYADVTDETTNSPVDTDFVMWGTIWELFGALARNAIRRGESADQYERLTRQAYNRFWARRHMELERFASQLHMPRPRWRSAVAAPQMGRGAGVRVRPGTING